MKRIFSFFTAIIFSLACTAQSYAAEKTVERLPDNTEVSVYARYVDNTGLTTIKPDENGNGKIILPDGTEITISGADSKISSILVEEVTDKEVLEWVLEKLGSKGKVAKVYYVYWADNNIFSPANGVTVTIKLKKASAKSVYAVNDSKADKLQATVKDSAVTFMADGSQFYALCNNTASTSDNNSSDTGDSYNLLFWSNWILMGGAVAIAGILNKKKKLMNDKT